MPLARQFNHTLLFWGFRTGRPDSGKKSRVLRFVNIVTPGLAGGRFSGMMDRMLKQRLSVKTITWIVFSFIIGLWFIAGLGIWFLFDATAASQFGDAFGIVNALFAGLAFAGVVVAIYLQMQELRLQRKELRETRAELRRSAEAQEKSLAAFKVQAESLLTAAYLNALNSLRQSYADEIQTFAVSRKIKSEHRRLRGRLEKTVEHLASTVPGLRADETLKEDQEKWWIEELRALYDQFQINWETEQGSAPANGDVGEGRQRAEMLLRLLATKLTDLISDLEESARRDFLNFVTDVKTVERCNNEQEFWVGGSKLISRLKELVMSASVGHLDLHFRP